MCSCGLLLTDRRKPWNAEIGSGSAFCEDNIPGYQQLLCRAAPIKADLVER